MEDLFKSVPRNSVKCVGDESPCPICDIFNINYAKLEQKLILNVNKEFEEQNLKSRVILQLHDELVFNIVPEEKEQVTQILDKLGFYTKGILETLIN